MSAAEPLIEEIKRVYWNTYDTIKAMIPKAERAALTLNEGRTIYECVLAFQTFLESKELQIKTFSSADYFVRASKRMKTILTLVRAETYIRSVNQKLLGRADTVFINDGIEGLSFEGKEFFNRCRETSKDWSRQVSSLRGMVYVLEDMEPILIELFSDLRLMSGLISFPSDHRTAIKDELIKSGFSKAAGFLDTAEQHMFSAPPRPKDALSNCRLAIESVIYQLLQNKALKIEKQFSVDLALLSSKHPELVDDALKKVMQAIFSYLSQKGSHSYADVEPKDLNDVEFGLEQTYRVLDNLLLKLDEQISPKGLAQQPY